MISRKNTPLPFTVNDYSSAKRARDHSFAIRGNDGGWLQDTLKAYPKGTVGGISGVLVAGGIVSHLLWLPTSTTPPIYEYAYIITSVAGYQRILVVPGEHREVVENSSQVDGRCSWGGVGGYLRWWFGVFLGGNR